MKNLQIFSENVSYFKSTRTIIPETMKLSHWLELCTTRKNTDLIQLINKIRSTENKQKRDELKSLLPNISPSSVILTRESKVPLCEKLVQYSGWMQFDVDLSQNPGMDAEYYREQIKKVVYVAFCGLSSSGRGVWGLVKVSQPDKLELHFKQLLIDFETREVYIDPASGGNPCHLRYYSFDPDAYIAKEFKIYDRIYTPPPQPNFNGILRPPISNARNKTHERIMACIKFITEKKIDVAPDYERYRNIGFAIVHEYGEDGRELFHAICSPCPKYSFKQANMAYDSWLKRNQGLITIGTFFHYCTEAGIQIS